MLFSSVTFVFLFLPAVLFTYFLSQRNVKNFVLILFSLVFYAWGEPRYVFIMLFTVLIDYVGALALNECPRHKKALLGLTLGMNLSVLGYFKYWNFLIENVNTVFGASFAFQNVVMPIGISFYTFQALSYVVDVYQGKVRVQRRFDKLLLYISFFPQLVAGPIVRYQDICDKLENRTETPDGVVYGIKRFIVGLAKKMLIANTLGAVADKIFALPVSQFDTPTAWIGALAYAFQLYYDFSGYSDMAIGLGSIFGFKFPENFDYPYISKSITEFWRRWHISLSTWFREYLYIPLGGNRVSKGRNLFNLFVVFLATGVWHGAAWTFVVWGLWHGAFIIIEKATGFAKKEGGRVFTAAKHGYTILVFLFGWVLFRADGLSYARDYIGNMLGLLQTGQAGHSFAEYVDNVEIAAFVLAAVCATPLFRHLLTIDRNRKFLRCVVNAGLIAMFVVSAATIALSTYNPFIYFRF